MAINGAHMLLYTTEPEALRAMLRDVFGWKHVDAGDGWLIFALPPAELGVHPAEGLGITVMLGLPGGVEVMLYEPRHAAAISPIR